jgi:uncharacterized protein
MLTNPAQLIANDQWPVAERWLRARADERRHLTIYLSGAHAYGFPSPDSDLDLKCVHIAKTADLLAMTPNDNGREVTEIVDTVELDYSSHELGMVLRGVVTGNGNYIERILGDAMIATDGEFFDEVRRIVQALLSRRVANHYAGFATSQLKLFDRKSTAKKALYVLRTAATGRALLTRGQLITDLRRLLDYCPPAVNELFAIKQRGEREILPPDVAQRWRADLVAAIAAVETDAATSILPVSSTTEALAAANDWLLHVRRKNF